MTFDIILAIAALSIAVIGTLKDKLSKRTKRILVAIASLTCLLTVVKAIVDDHDKTFMKTALISTLVPANSSYVKIIPEIEEAAVEKGFDDSPCHHSSDGMVCFFSSQTDSAAHATLILNRSEIAQMYANEIDKTFADRLIEKVFTLKIANKKLNKKKFKPKTPNERLIEDAFNLRYKSALPDDWDEEFVDRSGLVGMAVCYNMFHHWGTDYNYDPSFGLKVECETSIPEGKFEISTKDLNQLHNGLATDVFYKIEQLIREQYLQTK